MMAHKKKVDIKMPPIHVKGKKPADITMKPIQVKGRVGKKK